MPKLLQINSVVNYKSTGTIVENIGKTAISQGWESYIAYGREAHHSQSELIRIGTNWNVILQGLESRLLDKHSLGFTKTTEKFIDQIDKIRPDIIHLHNLHGYYLNIEVLFNFLAIKNIPVVWTFHDCWPITGHCAHFEFVACDKWKTECNICPQKTSYPSSYFLDRSTKNFRLKKKLFTSIDNLTIVAVSNWLAEQVKHSFLSQVPLKVINNGIDTHVFSPANMTMVNNNHKIHEKFIILGVTNIWNYRKGFNDLITLNSILDNDIQIILVGLTFRQIRSLPKNIIGLPRTENIQELVDLYCNSDVYVNPTYEDSFPTTNLEALASGTPVITYKTGGSSEAVSDDTGFAVEKGDINGLKNAISIIKSKGRDFYSNACIKRANELYSKNGRFLDYLNLYESLLTNRKNEENIDISKR